MILVTGANGHFGRATIHALINKGTAPQNIKALIRKAEDKAYWENQGVNAVLGDYNDYDSLISAFGGVSKLLLVSSNDLQNRTTQQYKAVRAAKEAGVQHIVYTSLQRKTEDSSSPLWAVADSHLNTEKFILESGLNYTILKNNLYLDLLPAFVGEHVFDNNTIYVPAGDGKISAVLRSEMAEAAAQILISEGHENKMYDFVNDQSVSYKDIAEFLSKISGKSIQYISPSSEEYMVILTGFGLPKEMIHIFTAFAVAQAQGELDKTSSDFATILGRKPTSVLQHIETVYSRG